MDELHNKVRKLQSTVNTLKNTAVDEGKGELNCHRTSLHNERGTTQHKF